MSRAANRDEARRMVCMSILPVTCQWTGEATANSNRTCFLFRRRLCVYILEQSRLCSGGFQAPEQDEHREVERQLAGVICTPTTLQSSGTMKSSGIVAVK